MKSLEGVNCSQVKFHFDEIIRISSNHKINVIPIWKQKLLECLNYILQFAFRYSDDRFCETLGTELTIQLSRLLNPFRS